jgi:hypothetical protein
MTIANKAAPPDMLRWQFQEIIWELGELQRHGSDPNCPCNLADVGEYCLSKHALALHGLARETIPMTSNPKEKEMLEQMQGEAIYFHVALKDRIVCSKPHKDEGDVVEWARSWRKKFESIYYVCTVKKAHLQQCKGTSCHFKTKESGECLKPLEVELVTGTSA